MEPLGAQVPVWVLQTAPVAHWASVVQLPPQKPVSSLSQANGKQGYTAVLRQLLLRSSHSLRVATVLLQIEAGQLSATPASDTGVAAGAGAGAGIIVRGEPEDFTPDTQQES